VRFRGRYFLYAATFTWSDSDDDTADDDQQLCLATSDDGLNFTRHPERVIDGRAPFALVDADVLYLFTAESRGPVSRLADVRSERADAPDEGGHVIRAFQSRDGIHFTPLADGPVLDRGGAGSWDAQSVQNPAVFRRGEWFYLTYAGDPLRHDLPHAAGLAASRDLVNWQRYPRNPIITADADDPDAFDGIWPLSMIFHGDTVYWFYEALGRLWDYEAKGVPKRTRISQNYLATLPLDEFPWAEQWAV